MSKNTKSATVNKFQTVETAKELVFIMQSVELNKLYSIAYNDNVEQSNRVAIFNESADNAKKIVETMKLQSDFMSAVARCTLWVDATQIVFFVGTVFNVFAQMSAKQNKKQYEELKLLFEQSIDKKYNERKLKNKTITALTETRHTFETIDDFKAFITLFSKCVASRAEQSKAEQSAKQSKAKQSKAETKSKAEQKKAQ